MTLRPAVERPALRPVYFVASLLAALVASWLATYKVVDLIVDAVADPSAVTVPSASPVMIATSGHPLPRYRSRDRVGGFAVPFESAPTCAVSIEDDLGFAVKAGSYVTYRDRIVIYNVDPTDRVTYYCAYVPR